MEMVRILKNYYNEYFFFKKSMKMSKSYFDIRFFNKKNRMSKISLFKLFTESIDKKKKKTESVMKFFKVMNPKV